MISGKDLIEYIIGHFDQVKAKQLQKLAYLTELDYMKKHGERLSDLEFKRYYFGPYSEGITEIKEEDENIVTISNTTSNAKFSRIISKDDQEDRIEQSIKEEIDRILSKYEGMSGAELEKLADETEPFIDTDELEEKIDLDGYADHYKALLSEDKWTKAIKRRDERKKEGAGKRKILKSDSGIDLYFTEF